MTPKTFRPSGTKPSRKLTPPKTRTSAPRHTHRLQQANMVFSPSLKTSANSLFTTGGSSDGHRGSRGLLKAGDGSSPSMALAGDGRDATGAIKVPLTDGLTNGDIRSVDDVGVEVDTGATTIEVGGGAVASHGGGVLAEMTGGAPGAPSSSPAAGDAVNSSPKDKDFVEEASVQARCFSTERRAASAAR